MDLNFMFSTGRKLNQFCHLQTLRTVDYFCFILVKSYCIETLFPLSHHSFYIHSDWLILDPKILDKHSCTLKFDVLPSPTLLLLCNFFKITLTKTEANVVWLLFYNSGKLERIISSFLVKRQLFVSMFAKVQGWRRT